MRLKEAAESITNELRVMLTLSRLLRYSERGIVPAAKINPANTMREYTDTDVARLRAVVLLAELLIPLRDVKLFLSGDEQVKFDIQKRIDIVKGLVVKAEELIRGNHDSLHVRTTSRTR